MSKVVFRVGKLKSWGAVATAGSHNLRERKTPNADPAVRNIEVKRVTDPLGVVGAVQAEIGTQTIRKNAVLATEIIISASPEYFRPNAPDKAGTFDQARLDAWREKMEPWIEKNFPHAVSVVLHLDETTPHYQIISVPLDSRGKLNCREKFGGPEVMREWQDRAADAVRDLGIERGLSGSLANHQDIKKFYEAVNSPTPALPPIKTRAPTPLPEPGWIETAQQMVPFSAARAERKELEEKAERQRDQRNREISARNAAAAKIHPQIAAKANVADLAKDKQKAAEATAAKLAKDKAAAKEQADRLRAMPLDQVLVRMYGAEEALDSKPSYKTRKFVIGDGRQIAITGDKWIENGPNHGDKGAINLVMHLDQVEFKPAVKLMAEHFDGQAIAAEHARHQVAKVEKEVAAIQQTEPTPTPTPAPARWPKVREWFEKVRGMPAKLIDYLHEKGSIFADERGNAVFAREKGGAFVRGTGEGSTFKRTIGKADAGVFVVKGDPKAGIYLVEGPMDAVALKAHKPDAVILATGGNLITPAKLKARAAAWGGEVHAAFDSDAQGERLAAEAARELGAKRFAPPWRCKDWSQAVKDNPELIDSKWTPPGEGGQGQKQEVTRTRSRGMGGPGF